MEIMLENNLPFEMILSGAYVINNFSLFTGAESVYH